MIEDIEGLSLTDLSQTNQEALLHLPDADRTSLLSRLNELSSPTSKSLIIDPATMGLVVDWVVNTVVLSSLNIRNITEQDIHLPHTPNEVLRDAAIIFLLSKDLGNIVTTGVIKSISSVKARLHRKRATRDFEQFLISEGIT